MSIARTTEILEKVTLPSGKALGTVTWEQLYIREGWAFVYETVESAATNYTIEIPADTGDVTRIILEPVDIDDTSSITLYENPVVGGTGGTETQLINLNRALGKDSTVVTFTKGSATAITFTGGTQLSKHESSRFSGDTGGRFWYLCPGCTYGLVLDAATTISMIIYEVRGD